MEWEQAKVLDVLEQAQRYRPFCEVCGSPTVPAARDGSLWLECSAVRQERPFLKRLLNMEFPALHTRRLILEDAA
jgi:hypothetical protein